MLKQVENPGPGPDDERPVGDLVHQLVEEGKAYARAELDVAKAIASSRVESYKVPAILLGAAFLFLQAAVVVLAMTLYLSLLSLVGPFAAGAIAFLVTLAISGGLAWAGVTRLRGGS